MTDSILFKNSNRIFGLVTIVQSFNTWDGIMEFRQQEGISVLAIDNTECNLVFMSEISGSNKLIKNPVFPLTWVWELEWVFSYI